MTMRTPLGQLKEHFSLAREVRETDQDGRTFLKRTRWTSTGLEAVSREVSGTMTDVVVSRWLEAVSRDRCSAPGSPQVRMVQQTCHERVCYRRTFERPEAK
eukprot:6258631-Prymnesium_polylepis.1